jgi:hypothetical protein
LTETKSRGDFLINARDQRIDAPQSRHLYFFFDIPVKAASEEPIFGQTRCLPQSTELTGSTSVQYTSEFSASQTIYGICDVCYWIEAQFHCLVRKVGSITQTVNLDQLYPRLQVTWPASHLTLLAKPRLLSRCRLWKTQLEIQIRQAELAIVEGSSPEHKSLIIPLAVVLDAPLANSAHQVDRCHTLRCSVKARWEIRTRFSSIPIIPETDRREPGNMISSKSWTQLEQVDLMFISRSISQGTAGIPPLPRVKSHD